MKYTPENVEMGEQWRDVVGFESYRVSDRGRVQNKKTGRYLPGATNGDGYTHVRLRPKEGKTKTRLVHRLVLMSFVGPPLPEQVCNHLDGVKTNNALDNLEWCSRSANSAHAVRLGLIRGHHGEKNPKAKLTAAAVVEMRRQSSLGVSYAALARRHGVTHATAFRAVVGLTWRSVALSAPRFAVAALQ